MVGLEHETSTLKHFSNSILVVRTPNSHLTLHWHEVSIFSELSLLDMSSKELCILMKKSGSKTSLHNFPNFLSFNPILSSIQIEKIGF